MAPSVQRQDAEVVTRIDVLLNRSIKTHTWVASIADLIDWMITDKRWAREIKKRACGIYNGYRTGKFSKRKRSAKVAQELAGRFYRDLENQCVSPHPRPSYRSHTQRLTTKIGVSNELAVLENKLQGSHFRVLVGCYCAYYSEKYGILWDEPDAPVFVWHNLVSHQDAVVVEQARRQIIDALLILKGVSAGFTASRVKPQSSDKKATSDWQPPKGYVGSKEIQHGHGVPATTLQEWWKQDNKNGDIKKRVKDPRSGEYYYPLKWFGNRKARWKPKPRSGDL